MMTYVLWDPTLDYMALRGRDSPQAANWPYWNGTHGFYHDATLRYQAPRPGNLFGPTLGAEEPIRFVHVLPALALAGIIAWMWWMGGRVR